MRRAMSRMPRYSDATPNARVASPFQSDRRGKFSSSTSAQARCDHALSREIAYSLMSASSNSAFLSRRRENSSVQVADQSYR